MARTGGHPPIADESRWLAALLRAPHQMPIFGRETLAPNWRVQSRSIPEHLVYFVTKNACVGLVGGMAVELSAGSLLWVPPGVPFEMANAVPRRPITLLRFRLVVQGTRWRGRAAVILDRAWELRPAMDGILDELSTHLLHREARLRAHLVGLFTGIFRARSRASEDRLTLSVGQCQRLTELVSARRSMRPGPADLAAKLRLSHDYFTRLFRRTFGLAPRLWIARERIRRAAMRLLDSSANASELAEEFGYPDVFAFSRQFKRVMGCSPRAYRTRNT